MTAEPQPPASTSRNPSKKIDAGRLCPGEQISRAGIDDLQPLIGSNGVTCVTLRRGREVMALFRGCPHPSALALLQELKVAVGIALSAGELRTVQHLDRYSYVFVADGSQTASSLKLAVTDLARRNWSMDESPTLVAVSTGTLVFGS